MTSARAPIAASSISTPQAGPRSGWVDWWQQTAWPRVEWSASSVRLGSQLVRRSGRLVMVHVTRAVGLATLLGGVALQRENPTLGAPGRDLLFLVLMLGAVYVTIEALLIVEHVFGEEERHEIGPLVQMTPVGSAGLMLGRIVTVVWERWWLLALQVPFALLATTLGGVVVSQILAGYLLLAAYTLAVVGICSLANVVGGPITSRLGLLAAFAAYVAVACLLAMIEGLLWLMAIRGWIRPVSWGGWLYVNVPSLLCHLTYGSTGTALSNQWSTETWLQLIVNTSLHLIVGLVAAGIACHWADLVVSETRKTTTPLDAGRNLGPRQTVESQRLPRFAAWPVFWKDLHFQHGGGSALISRGLLYPCGAAFVLAAAMRTWGDHPSHDAEFAWCTLWLAAAGSLFIEVTLAAQRMLHSELREQTWQSLLLTPLPMWQIIRQKIWAAVVPVLMSGLLLTVVTFVIDGFWPPYDRRTFAFCALAIPLFALLGMYASLVTLLSLYTESVLSPLIAFGLMGLQVVSLLGFSRVFAVDATSMICLLLVASFNASLALTFSFMVILKLRRLVA